MTVPLGPGAGHPSADCDHPDRHLCRGHYLCPDCCHAHAELRQAEAARVAWGRGHFEAVDDLGLHDEHDCPALAPSSCPSAAGRLP